MLMWLKRFWPLALLLLLQISFLLFPQIDLMGSASFYQAPRGFVLADSMLVQIVDAFFSYLHLLLLALLPWLMLASLYWMGEAEADLRRKLVFLFFVVALAPGLGAGVLQAESGRAHPVDIEVFAGSAQFTPAFTPANQCESDCSFVSRPAAMAFTLIALAWTFADRRWLWGGIVLGGIVGLSEVAAGTRFPSDVLFAFWIVLGVCQLLARVILGSHRIEATLGPA